MSIDTSRAQGIRSITVSPEFWADQPETVARLVSEQMKAKPAAVWMIVIGPPGSAEGFMDNAFIYGRAEDPLEDVGSGIGSDPA